MNVVIPTRFRSPQLANLIAVAKQVANVVIVHTEPHHAPVAGCVNVLDERRNIHHWWNTGLDRCVGPTLLLNDDIATTTEALTELLTALDDADLVTLPKDHGTTPLSGWCFGIHPDGNLRPDPAYGWWFGEDDIWRRATQGDYRIAVVNADVRHENENTSAVSPEFRQQIRADRRLYASRWK